MLLAALNQINELNLPEIQRTCVISGFLIKSNSFHPINYRHKTQTQKQGRFQDFGLLPTS